MRNNNGYLKVVLKVLLFCLIAYVVRKTGIFFMPAEDQMVDFQFNMITVSTVFAGFSFTVLGMLLEMFSEPMMEKLKDTSVVTGKSKKLMKSVVYFCASGILSLFFITKSDVYIVGCLPQAKMMIEYLFISCVLFVIIGIISFVASTSGVFQLIAKVYGYDKSKYKVKRREYQEEIEKAKEVLNNQNN